MITIPLWTLPFLVLGSWVAAAWFFGQLVEAYYDVYFMIGRRRHQRALETLIKAGYYDNVKEPAFQS